MFTMKGATRYCMLSAIKMQKNTQKITKKFFSAIQRWVHFDPIGFKRKYSASLELKHVIGGDSFLAVLATTGCLHDIATP